jgi:ribosome biogenesis GTPase / thiamine phosphate phosphatase
MNVTETTRTLQGIVVKNENTQYHIQSNGCVYICTSSLTVSKSSGKQRPEKARKPAQSALVDLPVVGDQVFFTPIEPDRGRITEVAPRRNAFVRRGALARPGAYASQQVIAANIDQVVPVFAAANPVPHWNMLDRYLVIAEASQLPALICISKADLVEESDDGPRSELQAELTVYRQIGYPIVWISAVSGEGLDELKAALKNHLSLLLGKSGVGKTSLLNALQPGLGQRVGAVNPATGKGRHTTTVQEMFALEGGGAIVDTPGERELGLWEISDRDLAYFFPEMRPYLGRCRFGLDCGHADEPDCAVRKAVMAGRISPRRYQSYLRLRDDP